ncbi:MAG: hypothetical protein J1F37_03160 [Oscillospiraceae bacterium]|nr:hypothetical protein [Oscillospiraceae bacterium]
MKKRILSLALALCVCLSVLPLGRTTAVAADSETAYYKYAPAGDEKNPVTYTISSTQQLQDLSDSVNDTDKKLTYSYTTFRLTQNIDLSTVCGESLNGGTSWTPIGTNKYIFAGTFDGNDYKISGLYINSNSSYQGLFGYITNGTVKNLTVEGTVSAAGYVGGIVGNLDANSTTGGRVENCKFEGEIGESGNITSNMSAGGIVGRNHSGTVTGCHFTGTVTRNSEYVGGIVGLNEGNNAVVENCCNEGAIVISGNYAGYAGGIVGVNNLNAKIMNCRNSGTVNGEGSVGVIGGIAGRNNGGKLKRCYNAGLIDGVDSGYVGGIVGLNDDNNAEVSECYIYNTAEVRGTNYVGGVVGQNTESAKITNCYNEATVTGTGNTGGIVGQNYTGTSSKNTKVGIVRNCYNRGSVTGKATGGIVGMNANNYGTGKVTNCYFLTGTATGGINSSNVPGQAESITADRFNSGEIAWMLQNPEKVNPNFEAQSELVWVQELVKTQKDPYPLLVNTAIGAGHPKVLKVTFKTEANSSYAVEYTNSGGTVPLPNPNPPVDADHVFVGWRETDISGVKFTGPVTGNDDMIIIAVQREKYGAEDANTTVITTTYGQSAEQDLGEWVVYAAGSSSSGKFTYKITDNGGLTGVTLDGDFLNVPTGINVGTYTLKITAHETEPQISPLSVGSYGTSDVTLTVKVIVNKADLTADMFTFTAPNNTVYNEEPKTATVKLNDGYIGVGDKITVKYYKVGSDEALAGPPTEVGKYVVKIDVNEGFNYNSAVDLTDEEKWTFEITAKGDLTVSTSVTGNMGDRNEEFTFNVMLSDETITGKYGEMEFTNGVATFTLKHGQSITAEGLPSIVTYTVTEYNSPGYSVTIEDNSVDGSSIYSSKKLENGDMQCDGNLLPNKTAQVNFINTCNSSIPTDATTEFGWMLPLFLTVSIGALYFIIKRLKAARKASVRRMPYQRR